MQKTISFIVCSNGYGHLKRCLQVVDAFPEGYAFNFFCKEPQVIYAKNEINFKKDVSIKFFSEYSENEFSWIDSNNVTWSSYLKWKSDLESSTELKNSDLIVSDNHVMPLNIFNNVILMGSFLWHDVTTSLSIEGQEIINFEIDLLLKLRPPLICLGDMVMPSLRNQTNLLEQGWFTNRITLLPAKNKEKKKVLITGGGTELINKQLLALTIVVISRLPNIEFFLDSKLFKMAEKIETKLSEFSFSEADFASLDYIICRPGVGILTDCVRFSVPPLVINDGFNREINHNSAMVNELGIGMGVDINENNLNEVADKLCKVIENDQMKLEYVKALNNRIVNGAYSASREIINFLNNG